jgi:hypothetical protein
MHEHVGGKPMVTANLTVDRDWLAQMSDRQETLIEATHGLTDVVAILSERVEGLIELCDEPAPEAGKESLHDVLARLAAEVAEQTRVLQALVAALNRRD